jgi:hypothetical protein
MTEPAEAGVKIYKKKAEQNRIELSANTDQEWGRQTKSRYGFGARYVTVADNCHLLMEKEPAASDG